MYKWINSKQKLEPRREAVFWLLTFAVFFVLIFAGQNLFAIRQRPDFHASINFVAFGICAVGDASRATHDPQKQRPVCVAFYLEIVNRGSRSILKDWRLTAELPTKQMLTTALLPGGHISFDSSAMKFGPDKWLPMKTRNVPVDDGALVEGHITFTIPNIDRAVVDVPGTKFILTFQDANGREYRVEHVLTAQGQ